MHEYLAEELGYFKENGVTVNQQVVGANVPAMVTSGQADLGFYALPAVMLAASKGQPMKVIRVNGGLQGGALLADPEKYPDVESLRGAKDCTMVSFPPGTSNYGYTLHLKEVLGMDCKVNGLATAPLQLGAIANGSAQLATGSAPTFAGATQEGQLKLLINPADQAQRDEFYPESWRFGEGGYFGVGPNLEKKKGAVVAFMKSIQQADEWMRDHSDQEVAQMLIKADKGFADVGEAALVPSVAYVRELSQVGNAQGYVGPDTWDLTVKGYESFKLQGYDGADPAYAYDSIIDMSYWTAANGQPPSDG